eukprot:3209534-Amphidinium_carterae.1
MQANGMKHNADLRRMASKHAHQQQPDHARMRHHVLQIRLPSGGIEAAGMAQLNCGIPGPVQQASRVTCEHSGQPTEDAGDEHIVPNSCEAVVLHGLSDARGATSQANTHPVFCAAPW